MAYFLRGASVSEPDDKSNRLVEGEGGKPLGYFLGADFYPQLVLDAKAGYEFAATLADYIETDGCDCNSERWQIRASRQGILIEINRSQISLLGENPLGNKAQEWYEHRYQAVLGRFVERFKPQVALSSRAIIRQLFEIDGDSRSFLAQHVMNIGPARFGPLNRPIQLLGVRIAFPAYELEWQDGEESKAEKADWTLELKVESWMADPKMLFVEADANWLDSMPWDSYSVTTTLVNRLQELTAYLVKVWDFLDHEE